MKSYWNVFAICFLEILLSKLQETTGTAELIQCGYSCHCSQNKDNTFLKSCNLVRLSGEGGYIELQKSNLDTDMPFVVFQHLNVTSFDDTFTIKDPDNLLQILPSVIQSGWHVGLYIKDVSSTLIDRTVSQRIHALGFSILKLLVDNVQVDNQSASDLSSFIDDLKTFSVQLKELILRDVISFNSQPCQLQFDFNHHYQDLSFINVNNYVCVNSLPEIVFSAPTPLEGQTWRFQNTTLGFEKIYIDFDSYGEIQILSTTHTGCHTPGQQMKNLILAQKSAFLEKTTITIDAAAAAGVQQNGIKSEGIFDSVVKFRQLNWLSFPKEIDSGFLGDSYIKFEVIQFETKKGKMVQREMTEEDNRYWKYGLCHEIGLVKLCVLCYQQFYGLHSTKDLLKTQCKNKTPPEKMNLCLHNCPGLKNTTFKSTIVLKYQHFKICNSGESILQKCFNDRLNGLGLIEEATDLTTLSKEVSTEANTHIGSQSTAINQISTNMGTTKTTSKTTSKATPKTTSKTTSKTTTTSKTSSDTTFKTTTTSKTSSKTSSETSSKTSSETSSKTTSETSSKTTSEASSEATTETSSFNISMSNTSDNITDETTTAIVFGPGENGANNNGAGRDTAAKKNKKKPKGSKYLLAGAEKVSLDCLHTVLQVITSVFGGIQIATA